MGLEDRPFKVRFVFHQVDFRFVQPVSPVLLVHIGQKVLRRIIQKRVQVFINRLFVIAGDDQHMQAIAGGPLGPLGPLFGGRRKVIFKHAMEVGPTKAIIVHTHNDFFGINRPYTGYDLNV